jgi:2,4-dienoyl-CoA reductase-like NADH-dependent reductase (Old Yellow Enzyme family)
MIADPPQTEAIVAWGRADCIALARDFLDDPRCTWHAADALGAKVAGPPQYQRARPKPWPGAALAHPQLCTQHSRNVRNPRTTAVESAPR